MIRSDAPAKIRGGLVYGDDLEAPGMLWAALVLAPVAHARIKRLDLAAAREVPGTVAVLGPNEAVGVLRRRAGRGERPLFPTEEILYSGQPLAAVAAETLEAAKAAARAVKVETDPLPVASEIDELFPEWPGTGAAKSPYVAAHVHARHGDVDGAFKAADLVHSEKYRTSGVLQVALEPHACLAEQQGETLYVRTCTQTPFGVREDAADRLGIPESTLVVEGTWVGGGFGGKGAAFLEPYAVLLAAATQRPVKLALGYPEEFRLGRSTLPSVVWIETATKKGEVTARRIRLLLDGGASLPGRDFAAGYAIGFLNGPYAAPAIELEGYALRTHKPPFGPHRAPFAPQCAFVAESHLDGLARRLGEDPVAFRLKQVWRDGGKTPLGQTVQSFGMAAALERARAIVTDWRAKLPAGHGIGVGCGYWSTGTGAGGEARLRLTPTELIIEEAEWEIGSGSVIRGLVAAAERELGLPAEAIRVDPRPTSEAPFDSGVYGSRTVAALGQAVQKAASVIAQKLAERMGGAGELRLERPKGRIEVVRGASRRSLEALLTSEERAAGGIVTHGRHYGGSGKIDDKRVLDGEVYPYGDFVAAVHVSEVDVDRETGQLTVVRGTTILDVGVALDRAMVTAQAEGAYAMGLGAALTEETLWAPDGRLLNPNLLDYRIPAMGEVPPLTVEILEGHPGSGPFGAKGVGEPPIIPVPAAVANAFADATGARVFELPLTPERVARALKLL